MHLGKYIPTNDIDLEQFVETVSDYAADWFKFYGVASRGRVSNRMGTCCDQVRQIFTKLLFQNEKGVLDKYLQEQLPMFLRRFERIYGAKQGPYAAGEEVSIAMKLAGSRYKDYLLLTCLL